MTPVLESKGDPPTLTILGNGTKPEIEREADRLARAIRARPELRLTGIDLSADSDLSTLSSDVALVLGGDGTVLHAAKRMGNKPSPVLGINLGRLGFLAELSPAEFLDRLDDLAARRYSVEDLMTLSCTLLPKEGPARTFRGLNDVVLRASPRSI